jgi:hypothetical protein
MRRGAESQRMREVTVERFVAATAADLEPAFTPERILTYEGTFEPVDVTETASGWTVTATVPGMRVAFDFEPREAGIHYAQHGEEGPFDAMETTITYEREREGSLVRATSSVTLGLPLAAVTDRVAAWKRRGELRRLLRALAADVE